MKMSKMKIKEIYKRPLAFLIIIIKAPFVWLYKKADTILTSIISGLITGVIITFCLKTYWDNNLSPEAHKKKVEIEHSDLKEADNLIERAKKTKDKQHAEEAYKEAMTLLYKHDQNPYVQFKIGLLYEQGKGVKANIPKAIELYENAASTGDTEAASYLGFAYISGNIVKKNLPKAIKLFSLAAEGNNPKAQYALGILNLNGIGTKENPEEAVKWFLKAAEQNHPESQYSLGICY